MYCFHQIIWNVADKTGAVMNLARTSKKNLVAPKQTNKPNDKVNKGMTTFS